MAMTDAGGSDDEHLSLCGSETTISTMQGVSPVLGSQEVTCKLCRAKSTDQCPLQGEYADKFCGLWPWSKYVEAGTGASGGKKAAGRICLICKKVFNSLGLSAKFDTPGAYWKHVTVATNQHEHQKFLASHSKWIELFNADPSKNRI